jgi:hypothetical protein
MTILEFVGILGRIALFSAFAYCFWCNHTRSSDKFKSRINLFGLASALVVVVSSVALLILGVNQ